VDARSGQREARGQQSATMNFSRHIAMLLPSPSMGEGRSSWSFHRSNRIITLTSRRMGTATPGDATAPDSP